MITTTKKDQEASQPVLLSVHFLTQDGTEHEEEPELKNNSYVSKNDSNKYGKVEVYQVGKNIQQVYFLKQFRGGRPGELLVDPYGMFAKPEDLSAFATQRGHRFCEYVQVPDLVYNGYLNYLHSRDSRYIRYCEKYLLDGVR